MVTLAERNDVVVRSNGIFSGRVPEDWRERSAPPSMRSSASGSPRRRRAAAGPSAWDGYVATVVTATGVNAIELGKRELVRLREGPGLYA